MTAPAGPARTVLLLGKTPSDRPRDGGALRTRAVRDQLASAGGWDVRAVAAVDPGRPSPAGAPTRRVPLVLANVRVVLSFLRIGSVTSLRWYRPAAVAEIVREGGARRAAGSVVEHTQLLGYLPVLPRPVVLDMHNVESELMANYARSTTVAWRRAVARYEAARLRRLERRALRDVAAVVVVSDHDRDVFRALAEVPAVPARRDGPAGGSLPPAGHDARPVVPVVVAPNGVGDAGFDLDGARAGEVVFVAHLGWTPNVEAAEWLVREVWPAVRAQAPGLRLRLVGRSPAARVLALAAADVEVVPDVESVVEHVARARVATAPLLAAGGTRLKILEALSCGTPVVATTLGALGLEGLAGPSLIVADDPADFARRVVELAAGGPSPADARALAEPYRWPRALAPLVDAVRTALDR